MARTVLLHQHSNMLSSLKVHKKKKHAKNPIKTDTFVNNTTFKARKYGNKTLKQTGGNYRSPSFSSRIEQARKVVSRIAADAAAKRDATAKRIKNAIELAKGKLGGLFNRRQKQPSNPTKRDLTEAQRKATLDIQLEQVREVAAKRNPQPPPRVEPPVSSSLYPSPASYTDVQTIIAQTALNNFKQKQIADASKAKADSIAALKKAQFALVAQGIALKLQTAATTSRKLTLITDASISLDNGRQVLYTYATTLESRRTIYVTSKVTRVELQTLVTSITNTVNGITTQVQKNVITAFLSADKLATEITEVQSVIRTESRELSDARLNFSELPSQQPSRNVLQETRNYEAAALALNTFAFTIPNPSIKQKVLTGISNIIDSATGQMRSIIDNFGNTISILSGQLLRARETVASVPGQKQAAIAGWVAQFGNLQKNLLSQSQRSEYSRTISEYKTRESRNSQLETSITTFVRAPLPPGKNIYPDSRNKDDAYSVYTRTVETSMRITFLTPDPMPTQAVSRINIGEVGVLQKMITDQSVEVFNSLEAATNSGVFIRGARETVSGVYSLLNAIAVVSMPPHSMVDGIRTTIATKTLENTQGNATLTGGAFDLLRQLALTQGAESRGNQVAATGQKVTGRRLAQDLKGGIFAPAAKQTSALTPVKDALTTLLNTTENIAEQKLNAQILSDTFGHIVNIYSRLTGSSSRSPTLQTELTIRLNAEIIKLRDTLKANTDSYISFLQKTSPSILNLWNMPTSTSRNDAFATLLDVSTKIDALRTQNILLTGRFTSILFQANKLLTVRSIRDLQVSIFSSKVLSSYGDSINYKNAVASIFSARKQGQTTALLLKTDSTLDAARRSVGSLAASFKINNAIIKRNVAAIGSNTSALSALRFELLVLFSSTQLGISAITKIVKHRPIDAITGMIASNEVLIASVISNGPYNNNETLTFPIESNDAQNTVDRMSLEILDITDDNSKRLTAIMIRRLEIGELPLLGRRQGLTSDLLLRIMRTTTTTGIFRNSKGRARAMRGESGIRLFNSKNSGSDIQTYLDSADGIRANTATLSNKMEIVSKNILEKDALTTVKENETRAKTALGMFESFYVQIKNTFRLNETRSQMPRNVFNNNMVSFKFELQSNMYKFLSVRDGVGSEMLAIGTPSLVSRTLESVPLSPDTSLLTDASNLRRELNEQNTNLANMYTIYTLKINDLQKLEGVSARSSNTLVKTVITNTFFTKVVNYTIKSGILKLRETTKTILNAFKSTDNSKVIKDTSSSIAENAITIANKNKDMSEKIALKNAALDLKAGEVRKGSELTAGKGFVATLKGLFILKGDDKVVPFNSRRNTIKSGLTKTSSRIIKITASVISLALAIGGIDVDISIISDIINILPSLPNMSILNTAREALKILYNSNTVLLNFIARCRREISEIGSLIVKVGRNTITTLPSIYGAKTAWRAIKYGIVNGKAAMKTAFDTLKGFDTSAFIKGFASATQIGYFNVSSKNSALQNIQNMQANNIILKLNITIMRNMLEFSAFMFGKLRNVFFGKPNAKVVPRNLASDAHVAGINRLNDASRLVNQLNADNVSKITAVGNPIPPQILNSSPTLPNLSVLNTAKALYTTLSNRTAQLVSYIARRSREIFEISKLNVQSGRRFTGVLPSIYGVKVAYNAIKKEIGKATAAIKGLDNSVSIKNLFSADKVNTYDIDVKNRQLETVTGERDAAAVVKAAEVRKGNNLKEARGLINILKGFFSLKTGAKVVPFDFGGDRIKVGINKNNDAVLGVKTLKADNDLKITAVGNPIVPQTLNPAPTLPNLSVLNTAKALYSSLRDRGTQLVSLLGRHLREMTEIKKLDNGRTSKLIGGLPSIYGVKKAYASLKKELGRGKEAIMARFNTLKGSNLSFSIKNLFSADKVNAYDIDVKNRQLETVTGEKNAALLVKASEVRKGSELTAGKGLVNVLKGFFSLKAGAKVVPFDFGGDRIKVGINKNNDAFLGVNTLKADNNLKITAIGNPLVPQTLNPPPTLPNLSVLNTAKALYSSLRDRGTQLVSLLGRHLREMTEIKKLDNGRTSKLIGGLPSIYGVKTAYASLKKELGRGKEAIRVTFNTLKAFNTEFSIKNLFSSGKINTYDIDTKNTQLQTLTGEKNAAVLLKAAEVRKGSELTAGKGLVNILKGFFSLKTGAKVVPFDFGGDRIKVGINKNNDAVLGVKTLKADNDLKITAVGNPVPPQTLNPPPSLPNTSVLNAAKLAFTSLTNKINQLIKSIAISSRKMFEISKLVIKNPRILMVAILSLSKIKNANHTLGNAAAKRKESDASALTALKENTEVDTIKEDVARNNETLDEINIKTAAMKAVKAEQDGVVSNKTKLSFTKQSLTLFNSIIFRLKPVLFASLNSKHITKSSLHTLMDAHSALLDATVNKLDSLNKDLADGIDALTSALKVPDSVPNKPYMSDTSYLTNAEKLRATLRKINDNLDAFYNVMTKQTSDIKALESMLNSRSAKGLRGLVGALTNVRTGFRKFKTQFYSSRAAVTRSSLSEIQQSKRDIADTLATLKGNLENLGNVDKSLTAASARKSREVLTGSNLYTIKGFVSQLRISLLGKQTDSYVSKTSLHTLMDAHSALLDASINKLDSLNKDLADGIDALTSALKIPDSVPNKPYVPDTSVLENAEKLRAVLRKMNDALNVFYESMIKKIPEIKNLESMLNVRGAKGLRTLVRGLMTSKNMFSAYKKNARLLRPALIRPTLSEIQQSKKDIADTLANINNELANLRSTEKALTAASVRKSVQDLTRSKLYTIKDLVSGLYSRLLGKETDLHVSKSRLHALIDAHSLLLDASINKLDTLATDLGDGIDALTSALKTPDSVPNKPFVPDALDLADAKKLRDELSKLNEELTALKAERNKEILDIEKLSDTLDGRDTLSGTLMKIYGTVKTYKDLKRSVHERSSVERTNNRRELEAIKREIATKLDALKDNLDDLTDAENARDSKTTEYNTEVSTREMLNTVKSLISDLHSGLLGKETDSHVSKTRLHTLMDSHSSLLDANINKLDSLIADLVNAADAIQSALKIPDTLGNKPVQPDTSQLANAENLRAVLRNMNDRLAILDAIMTKEIPEIKTLESLLTTRSAKPLHNLISALMNFRTRFSKYKTQFYSLRKDLTRSSLSEIQQSKRDIADTLARLKGKLENLGNVDKSLTAATVRKSREVLTGSNLYTIKGFVSQLRNRLLGKQTDTHVSKSRLHALIDAHSALLDASINKLDSLNKDLTDGINALTSSLKIPDSVPNKPDMSDTSYLANAEKLRATLRKMNDSLEAFYNVMTKQTSDIKALESLLNTRGAQGLRTLVSGLRTSKNGFGKYKSQTYSSRAVVLRSSLSEIQQSKQDIAGVLANIKSKLENIRDAEQAISDASARKSVQVLTGSNLYTIKGFVSQLRNRLLGKQTDTHVSKSRLHTLIDAYSALLDASINKLDTLATDLGNGVDTLTSALKVPDSVPNKPYMSDTSYLANAEKLRATLRKMNDSLNAFYDVMSKQIPEIKGLESMLNMRNATPLQKLLTMLSGSKKVFNSYKKSIVSLRRALTRSSLSEIQQSKQGIADTLATLKDKSENLTDAKKALTDASTRKSTEVLTRSKLYTFKGLLSMLRSGLLGKETDSHVSKTRLHTLMDTHSVLLDASINKLDTLTTDLVDGIDTLTSALKIPDSVPNKPRTPDTSDLANAQKLRELLRKMNDNLDAFYNVMTKQIPEVKSLESMLNIRGAKGLRGLVAALVTSKNIFSSYKKNARLIRETVTRATLFEIQQSKKDIADTLAILKDKLGKLDDAQDLRDKTRRNKESEIAMQQKLNEVKSLVSDLHAVLDSIRNDNHMPRSRLNKDMNKHKSLLTVIFNNVLLVKNTVVSTIMRTILALKRPDTLGNKPIEIDTTQLENAKTLRDELSKLNEDLTALKAERNKEIPDIKKLSDTLEGRDTLSGTLKKIYGTIQTYKDLKRSMHERSGVERTNNRREVEAIKREIAETLDALKDNLDDLTDAESARDSKTTEYNTEVSTHEMLDTVKSLISDLHSGLLGKETDSHVSKTRLHTLIDGYSSLLDASINKLDLLVADLVNATDAIQSSLKIPDTLGNKPVQPDTLQLASAKNLRDALRNMNDRLAVLDAIITKQIPEVKTLESVLTTRSVKPLRGLVGALMNIRTGFSKFKTQFYSSRKDVLRSTLSEIQQSKKDIADTLATLKGKLENIRNAEQAITDASVRKSREVLTGSNLYTIKGFVSQLRNRLLGKQTDTHVSKSRLHALIDAHSALLDASINKLDSLNKDLTDGINALTSSLKIPDSVPNKPDMSDTSYLANAEKLRATLRKMNDSLEAFYDVMIKQIPEIKNLESMLNTRGALGLRTLVRGLMTSKNMFSAYKKNTRLLRQALTRATLFEIQQSKKDIADTLANIQSKLGKRQDAEQSITDADVRKSVEVLTRSKLYTIKDLVSGLYSRLLGKQTDSHVSKSRLHALIDAHSALLDASINKLDTLATDLGNGIDALTLALKTPDSLPNKPYVPDTSDLANAKNLRDALRKMNDSLEAFYDVMTKQIPEIKNLESMLITRSATPLHKLFAMLSGSKKVFNSYKKSIALIKQALTRSRLSEIQQSKQDIAGTLATLKAKLENIRNAEQAITDASARKSTEVLTRTKLYTFKGLLSMLRSGLLGKQTDTHVSKTRLHTLMDAHSVLLDASISKLDTLNKDLADGIDALTSSLKTPDSVPNKPRTPDTSYLADAKNLRALLRKMNDNLEAFYDVMTKQTSDLNNLESILDARGAKGLRGLVRALLTSKNGFRAYKMKDRLVGQAITRASLSQIKQTKKDISDILTEINTRLENIRDAEKAITDAEARKNREVLTHDKLDVFTVLAAELNNTLFANLTDSHVPKSRLNEAMKQHEILVDSTINKLETIITDLVNAAENIKSGLRTPDNLGNKPRQLENSDLENAKKLRDELSKLNEDLTTLNAERNKGIPNVEKLLDVLSGRGTLSTILGNIIETATTYKNLKDSVHERSAVERTNNRQEIEAINREIAETLDTLRGKLDDLTNAETRRDTKIAEYNTEVSNRGMLDTVKSFILDLYNGLLGKETDSHVSKTRLHTLMDGHSNLLDANINKLDLLVADLVNATDAVQSALKTPDTLGNKPVEPDSSELANAENLRAALRKMNDRLAVLEAVMTKEIPEVKTLESVLSYRNILSKVIGILVSYKNAFKAYKKQVFLSKQAVIRDNASDVDTLNKSLANTSDTLKGKIDDLANAETTRDTKIADKNANVSKHRMLDTVKGVVSNLYTVLSGKLADVRLPRSIVNKGIQQYKIVLDVAINTIRNAYNTVIAAVNSIASGLRKPDVINKPVEPDTSQLRDAEKLRDALTKMNERLDALDAIMTKQIPDIQTLKSVLSERNKLSEAIGMLSSYKNAFNVYKTQIHLSKAAVIRDNLSDIDTLNKNIANRLDIIKGKLDDLANAETLRDSKTNEYNNEHSNHTMLKEAREVVSSLRNELLKLNTEHIDPRRLQRNATEFHLAEVESTVNNLQKDQSDVDNGINEIGNPEPPLNDLSDEPTLLDNLDLIEAQRLRDSLNNLNSDLGQLNDIRKKNIEEIGNLEDVSAMRKKLGDTVKTLTELKMAYKSQKDSAHQRNELTRDNLNNLNELSKENAKILSEINDKLARLADLEQALNTANKNKDAESLTLRMIEDTKNAVSLLKDTLAERTFDPMYPSKFRRDGTQSKLDALAEDIANLTTKKAETDTAVTDMGTPEPSNRQQLDKPTNPDTSELDAAKNLRDRLTEANDRLTQLLEVSKNQTTDIEVLNKTLSQRLEITKLIELAAKEKMLWKSIKRDIYSKRKDLSRDSLDSIKALERSINDTLKTINDKIDALRQAENNVDVLTKDKDGNTNTREMIQTAHDAINRLRETLLGDPSDLHTERKPDRDALEANLKRLESDIATLEAAMLKLDDTINETNPKEPSDRNPGDKPMSPDDLALKLAKDMRDMLEITNGLLHDRSKSLRDISDHIDTIRETIALRIEEINRLRQALEQTSNRKFKEKQEALDARRKAEKEAQRLKDEDVRKKMTDDDYKKRRLDDLDAMRKRDEEAAKKLKEQEDIRKKKDDDNNRLKREIDALLRALQSIKLLDLGPMVGLTPSVVAGILGGIGAAGLAPSIFSGSTPPSSGQQPPPEEGPGNGSADGQADGTAAGTADGSNKGREEARRQYNEWLREQQDAELASTADEIEASAQEESNANSTDDPEENANNSGEPAENENYPNNRRA